MDRASTASWARLVEENGAEDISYQMVRRYRVTDCGLPWVARAQTTEAEQAARVFLSEDRRNPWRLPANPRDSVGITAMGHFLGDLQALCETSEALAALYPAPETGQGR